MRAADEPDDAAPQLFRGRFVIGADGARSAAAIRESSIWGEGKATARAVLLATGVRNRRPDMDEELHDEALARGLIRYCPICDGYEVTDKKVGVIGSDSHGVAEAVFIRSFTADVTLIAPDKALSLKREDGEKRGGTQPRPESRPARAAVPGPASSPPPSARRCSSGSWFRCARG